MLLMLLCWCTVILGYKFVTNGPADPLGGKPVQTETVKTLCIMGDGPLESAVIRYLENNGAACTREATVPDPEGHDSGRQWDLILIDADLEGGDMMLFLDHCRGRYRSIPIITFHEGARGSRDAALIRMGAFDALPKDIGRWNTEVYLNRALEQARLVRTLLSQSRTDHVTGLFNQRFLYENLHREIRRAVRTRRPLCIALLDLDNFKSYNDAYGHLAGDEALRQVAGVLAGAVRQGVDSAYRYGGDEFMLVLPDTEIEDAARTLERVLKLVRARVSDILSFSIGVAGLGKCTDVQSYIKSADEAMYTAKNAGGDRIETCRRR